MHLGLQEAQRVLHAGNALGHPGRAQHIVVLSDFIPRNKQDGQSCPQTDAYDYENCIMAKGVAALKSELSRNGFYRGARVSQWAYKLDCGAATGRRTNVDSVVKEVIQMIAPSAGHRGQAGADVSAALAFTQVVLSDEVCPTTTSTTTPTTTSTATTTTRQHCCLDGKIVAEAPTCAQKMSHCMYNGPGSATFKDACPITCGRCTPTTALDDCTTTTATSTTTPAAASAVGTDRTMGIFQVFGQGETCRSGGTTVRRRATVTVSGGLQKTCQTVSSHMILTVLQV